jgi:O-antigen ligase
VNAGARWLALLATCGAALLVLMLYAPSLQASFLVPKFAALDLTASAGFVAFVWLRMRTGEPRWTSAAATGALLVLATSAVSWLVAATRVPGAPYALAALGRWGSLFGLACATSVIADAPDARRRLLEAVTIAGAAVAAIGLLQHLEMMPLSIPVISTPGSTFGNRNFAAEAMAMAMPLGLGAIAGLRGDSRSAFMWVAVTLELVFLAVTRTRGAWLGAACGLVATAALLRLRWPRGTLAVAVAAAVMAIVAASWPARYNPRDVGDAKRYSGVVDVLEAGLDPRSTAFRTRLGLWRRTLAMVTAHPWFGVGPGNWPVVFPLYAEPGATQDGVLSAARAPRQAHDDLLERAGETGIPGLLSLVALVGGVAMAARRRLREIDYGTRTAAAAAVGALTALGVVSLSSFPLEMPGTLALAGLALGLVVADAPPPAAHPVRFPVLTYAAVVGALVLVAGAVVRAERSVRGGAWLGAAERSMRRDRGPAGATEALDCLKRTLDVTPNDYRARLRVAQMLLREHRPDESAQAARSALSIEPYSPNGWAELAAAELALGDAGSARRDASQALSFLGDYPLALHVRIRAAEAEGDQASAQADRRRLQALAEGAADRDTANDARALLGSP